jgi:hypothetical protein
LIPGGNIEQAKLTWGWNMKTVFDSYGYTVAVVPTLEEAEEIVRHELVRGGEQWYIEADSNSLPAPKL